MKSLKRAFLKIKKLSAEICKSLTNVKNIKIFLLSSLFFPTLIILNEKVWMQSFLKEYWLFFLPLALIFLLSIIKIKIDANTFLYSFGAASGGAVLLHYLGVRDGNIGIFLSFGIFGIYLLGKSLENLFIKKIETPVCIEKYSSDLPITSKNKDLFDFSDGAKNLSNLIFSEGLAENGSYVIGISGPWGSGKSSFINLALEDVYKKKTPTIKILRMLPWFNCKKISMEEQFLDLLNKHGILDDGELKKYFFKYAKVLDVAYTDLGEKLFQLLISNEKKESIEQIQNHISEFLINNKIKIIVVIDDIDRLSAGEILDVFQLVKATANFKNIVYILGYDYKQLERIMEGEAKKSWAGNYLEKMIQTRIGVPLISHNTILDDLYPKIFQIIDNNNLYFDKSRWEDIQKIGFNNLFFTPREIKRYLNQLKFYHEIFHDKLDLVDTLTLIAILSRYPNLEEHIRDYEYVLTFPVVSGHNRNVEKLQEDFYFEIDDSLKKLIVELFPALSGKSFDQIDSKKKMRICHREYFELFFSQFNPKDTFSPTLMQEFFELSSNTSCRSIVREISNMKFKNNEGILEFLYLFPAYIHQLSLGETEKWFSYFLVDYMTFPSRYPHIWMRSDTQSEILWILREMILKKKLEKEKIILLLKKASEEVLAIDKDVQMLYLETFLCAILRLTSAIIREEINESSDRFKEQVGKIYHELFDKISWSGSGLSFHIIDGRTLFTGADETASYIENNLWDIKLCIDLISGCYTHSWGIEYRQTLQKPFLNGKVSLEKMNSRISEILKEDKEKQSEDKEKQSIDPHNKNLLTDHEIRKAKFFLKLAEARLNGTEEFY